MRIKYLEGEEVERALPVAWRLRAGAELIVAAARFVALGAQEDAPPSSTPSLFFEDCACIGLETRSH